MPLYRDFLTIILWKSHFQSSCYKDSCCTFKMWGPLLGISATHLTPNGKGRKVLRQWGQDEGRGLLVFAFGYNILGFLGGSAGKESVCNVGDLGLIPGWEDQLEKGTTTHSSMSRKTVWRFPKKLWIKLSYNPVIPLLGIYPEETITEKDTCTPVFIAALFTVARTWKQPRCPQTNEWIKKLWYIYTMEYYSAIKRNTFESILIR